jgi:hypothetical protein
VTVARYIVVITLLCSLLILFIQGRLAAIDSQMYAEFVFGDIITSTMSIHNTPVSFVLAVGGR